jgi:hypothetical protein
MAAPAPKPPAVSPNWTDRIFRWLCLSSCFVLLGHID